MRYLYLFFSAICILLIGFVIFLLPKNDPAYYYRLINSEVVATGTKILDEEYLELSKCKNDNDTFENICTRNFYEKYTEKNGVNKTFSHLALLQQKDPDFIKDCHYISHGIGHAQLRLDGRKVEKSFAIMSENSFYRNMATCGNGYFHGVIEEYARYATSTEKLIEILTGACGPESNQFTIDCYHGMGHATFIQTVYKELEALKICDAVTSDATNRFACYTGVFMEMVNDIPEDMLVSVTDGIMSFDKCETMPIKYKPACFDQLSSLLEKFTKNKRDFVTNIKYCKQIKEPDFRIHCVKVFAGRALRIMQTKDIGKMCANTSNIEERLLCTGIFARRIGKSLDISGSTPLYLDAVKDICKTLPFYLVYSCVNKVLNDKNSIYLPTDEYVKLEI